MKQITLQIALAIALLTCASASAQLRNNQSYIVLLTGDTVLCRYLDDEQPSKITFHNMVSSDVQVIKKKKVAVYRRVYTTGDIINHSFTFRRMPIDGNDPTGKTALMHELIANKGNALWKYDRDEVLTYYYVYNKGLFKGEIDQQDHVNELVKYFGECSRDILESDEFNKFYSFNYVTFSEIYNRICLE